MDTDRQRQMQLARVAARDRYTRIEARVDGATWAIQAYRDGWQIEREGKAVAWTARIDQAARVLAERVGREVPAAEAFRAAAAEFAQTVARTVDGAAPLPR